MSTLSPDQLRDVLIMLDPSLSVVTHALTGHPGLVCDHSAACDKKMSPFQSTEPGRSSKGRNLYPCRNLLCLVASY